MKVKLGQERRTQNYRGRKMTAAAAGVVVVAASHSLQDQRQANKKKEKTEPVATGTEVHLPLTLGKENCREGKRKMEKRRLKNLLIVVRLCSYLGQMRMGNCCHRQHFDSRHQSSHGGR